MQTRLKILICAYAVDNKDVGEAHLTWHWLNELAKHVDITLITRGSRINESCGFEGHETIKLEIVKPKISFQWAGAFDRVLKPDYFEFFSLARNAAKKLVARENFDACHHIAPHSPRYPSPLHSLGVKLFVGPIHGGLHMPKELEKNGSSSLRSSASRIDRLRNKYDPVMRKHFSSAKKLLISAPYVTENLPEKYHNKCVVIPPQPPEILTNPPSKSTSNKLRLIFVGRLIPTKGIDLAVEAIKRLNNPNDVEFCIYGTGELNDSLESFIKDSNLSSSIFLKGFVKHNEILRAFHRNDILLFPSLKEAWGLAVSEAMASGLGVICINRGGPGYMVDEFCGLKVEVSDRNTIIEQLTKSIQYLIDNPEKVKEFGENSEAKINKHFTWNALTEKLISLYRE